MTSLVVLGIAQDAGYPQLGCTKDCCNRYWEGVQEKELISCIAVVDGEEEKYWLIDATPDIAEQIHQIQKLLGTENLPEGIFLTHAHIGHYTGLMQFGREAYGSKNLTVYAMPKMKKYLMENGPWGQLTSLGNIDLKELHADSMVRVSENISLTPFLVPHRDEYSETVGYRINGSKKSSLFIPDIDKWDRWERDISRMITENDYALLDGTFFENGEIPGRDMSLIPHPFVVESMEKFNSLPKEEKKKIHFIHFNHTNPLLNTKSEAFKNTLENGFNIAQRGLVISLE